MFIRSKTRIIAAATLMLISLQVTAQNFQCAQDQNGDGDLDDIGELEACLAGSDGAPFCPIGSVDCVPDEEEVCPINGSIPCEDGQCSIDLTATCEHVRSSQFGHVYRCPSTGESFSSSSNEAASRACFSQCSGTRTESCVQNIESYSCPLGETYSCSTSSDSPNIPQCTANLCQDISVDAVVDTIDSVSSDMYMDDGERNAEGVCLGETRIFSGRPMSCRLAGASSAYKNCCRDNNGKVYYDSQGNVVETTLTNKAITATAAAAWAAGSAFTTAISAGATTTQAANAGSSAFVNSIQGAFDPASLATAVAIALIQTWLANACDQESMETATLKASGYCFQVGTICTTRWLGSCIQREEVNCCYNSMLARIVNEQGLEQVLGEPPYSNVELSEDSVDALDCGGFTPQQFQALDYQRIDFSEYEGEINAAVTERINNEGDEAIERFINNDED